jgi:short-subunit dehydrogenase
MSKSILIIGAGPGISTAMAEKFGHNGYSIGLINRNADTAKAIVDGLATQGITAFSSTADIANTAELQKSITDLKEKLGGVNVLLYNAAAVRVKDILLETADELAADFRVNVGGAVESIKFLYNELKKNKGSVLLTGGGLSIHPHHMYGSLSIGKAGIRSLALQLHDPLKADGIYAGTLTITDTVTTDGATHSYAIVADKFWELFTNGSEAELVY